MEFAYHPLLPRALAAAGLLVLVGAGCDSARSSAPESCAGRGWPLAVLTVSDARTGRGLAGRVAVEVLPRGARPPAFAVEARSDSVVAVAPGYGVVFDLVVAAPGYTPARLAGMVARDGCPVGESARVRVPLQPAADA